MALPSVYATAGVITGSADRANLVNVCWYQPDTTITAGDGQDAADQLAAEMTVALAPLYKAFLATDAFYRGVNVRVVISGVSFTSLNAGGAGAGTVSSDSLPDYAAALIRKRTLLGGKSGRGRWFVGPVPEAVTDNGRLTGGGINQLAQIAIRLSESMETVLAAWTPKHYTRTNDTLLTIESTSAQQVLATQRRRRLRPTII